MHNIVKKMIDYGAIDTEITSMEVNSWFESATISFEGKGDIGQVKCRFIGCYEISLDHDKCYDKRRRSNGELDYSYFIQDVEINEFDSFFEFKINAWPLNGKIICKKIELMIE